jgi:hypothetical protein
MGWFQRAGADSSQLRLRVGTDHAMQTLGARAGTSRAMIALSRPTCGARVSDLQELALTYVVQQVLGLPSHR